jgi:hypothetical protein
MFLYYYYDKGRLWGFSVQRQLLLYNTDLLVSGKQVDPDLILISEAFPCLPEYSFLRLNATIVIILRDNLLQVTNCNQKEKYAVCMIPT